MVTQRRRARRHQQEEGAGGGMMEQMYAAGRHPQELVEHYPISTSLVVFGLGIGVGVILAQAIAEPLSRSLHEPTMTERMGRSFQEALHQYMPEMSRRMGV